MVKVRSMSVVRDSLYQVLIDRVFEKEPEASHSEVVAYLASQYSSPMSGDRWSVSWNVSILPSVIPTMSLR